MSRRSFLHAAGPATLVGLLAFTLTVEWRAQRAASHAVAGRRAALASIVESRQRRTVELEHQLTELRAQIDRASTSGDERLSSLRALADALGSLSGTEAVQGPGIVVTLTDAADAEPGLNRADSRIQDVDLQSVVNQLWNVGAEAIAVNGQRIVATSAIRNAGDAVLVNYRVLSSPYRVRAIGDARALNRDFGRSAVARRFRNWEDVYGLGFRIESANRISLPAFGGTVRFRYAQSTQ